ncbi:site-specific DNA-methyltransferase, partial [Vibrio anguillarum]|nr:site-specific DNA-methyltransferase [Vibrio anguillarum]
SGFVGQASELLNRNFRGNDLNIEAVELTKARINGIRQTL